MIQMRKCTVKIIIIDLDVVYSNLKHVISPWRHCYISYSWKVFVPEKKHRANT